MSVQAALDFIHALSERQETAHGPIIDPLAETLHSVVEVGRQMGFDFTADDLRAAFRHEWQRRWLHFGVAKQG